MKSARGRGIGGNGGGKGSVYDRVGKSYKNANFVIHAVCHIDDTQPKTIESMIYCISFISCMGIIVNDIDGSNIWITGTAMSNLIAHSNTKKNLYNNTKTMRRRSSDSEVSIAVVRGRRTFIQQVCI